MPCPYSHFITRAYATPIFTFRTCSYSVPINTLVLVHVPFHGRVFVFGVCAYYRNAVDRDKAVFMFGVCAYYNNASGPGQSHVHVWCVSITGTPVGPDKAVFMFGVCAYYRNAVDRDLSLIHI